MKARLLALASACAIIPAHAQTPVTEFPDGAAPLAQAELQAALADKVFSVRPASGAPWRWELKGNGYFFLNVGNFADSGRWRTQDGSVCTEGQRVKAACNEVRAVGADLFMKRDSGEVVQLVPR